MMTRRYLFLLVFAVSVQLCFAQKEEQNNQKSYGIFSKTTMNKLNLDVNETGARRTSGKPGEESKDAKRQESNSSPISTSLGAATGATASAASASAVTSSIERYANYTMRNGWLEGIGKVTEEQARHMSWYYEFSNRNCEGHWERIRALNGHGRFDGTYCFSKIFTNRDYDKSTYQWDDIPLNTVEIRINKGIAEGDLVYHYYDASGEELCKGFSRKLDEKSVLMHFSTDKEDTIPLYENRVAAKCELIYYERDNNGFDVYIRFFSRDGGAAVDTDSSFALRRTFNQEGNILTSSSLDLSGRPMISRAGYNGWETTFNAMGKREVSTNLGTDRKPMLPVTNQLLNKYIRDHYVYDRYGRTIKIYYTDGEDKAMADGNGMAAITYQYNDRGQTTEYRFYDIDGKPCEPYGFFCCKQEYDKNGYTRSIRYCHPDGSLAEGCHHETFEYLASGKETLYECRDSQGRWVNNSKTVARKIISYDDDGSIVNEVRWSADSTGNLSLSYYRHENADSIVYFDGNKKDIILKDKHGSTYAHYMTRPNGGLLPMLSDDKKYYKEVYQRIEEPHKTTFISAYYDQNGRLIFNSDQNESWTIIDSLQVTKQWKEFDHTHQPISNILAQYSDFKDKQYSALLLNSFDVPCWHTLGKYTWYKRVAANNFKNDPIMNAYYNEWDEPAYVVTDKNTAYHMIFDAGNSSVIYDEHGTICYKTDSLYNALPKALSIEVTDSTAYRLGMKDNDIILQYGGWMYQANQTSRLKESFYLETILKAQEEKVLLLLRSDSKTKKTWVEKITLPPGKLSDLGINPILRCLASKENQRLTDTFTAYIKDHPSQVSDAEQPQSLRNRVLVFAPKKNGYNSIYSEQNIRSPFIALMLDFSAVDGLFDIEDEKEDSCLPENQWILEDEQHSNRYSQLCGHHKRIKVYYTDDFVSVKHTPSWLDLNSVTDSVYMTSAIVPDSTYEQLVRLRKSLRKEGYQVRELVNDSIVADSTLKQDLTPLEIINTWQQLPEHSVMDRNDVISQVKGLYLDELLFDADKCKFYGIDVDEFLSPESVREYHSLLSRMDQKKLTVLKKPSASDDNVYVWGLQGSGKGLYRQIVIYHRHVFLVIKGKIEFRKK